MREDGWLIGYGMATAGDHLDRASAAHRPALRLAVRIRLSRRGHPCRSL
jgi:hypothetical protein